MNHDYKHLAWQTNHLSLKQKDTLYSSYQAGRQANTVKLGHLDNLHSLGEMGDLQRYSWRFCPKFWNLLGVPLFYWPWSCAFNSKVLKQVKFVLKWWWGKSMRRDCFVQTQIDMTPIMNAHIFQWITDVFCGQKDGESHFLNLFFEGLRLLKGGLTRVTNSFLARLLYLWQLNEQQ